MHIGYKCKAALCKAYLYLFNFDGIVLERKTDPKLKFTKVTKVEYRPKTDIRE